MITMPPYEMDSQGKIILENCKIREINFGKNFHPEFKGQIFENKGGVWIPIIEAREIGKGHFSKLINEFKNKYEFITIPTPSKMMIERAIHLGFRLEEKWFGEPFNEHGFTLEWKKNSP